MNIYDLRIDDNLLFFRKATQRLDREWEIGVCRDHSPPAKGVIAASKTRLLCFWLVSRRRRELGGQLSETETGKSGNMSEVLRRNPSNKTSEIRRTFVFRTSTPVRAAVTSENKHSICDIFSEYFLLKVLHNLYILPKLFIKLCWVACYIADSFNKSQMWQIIHRCLNACF